MPEARDPSLARKPETPVAEGWDPVAERWDAWSKVTDELFSPATMSLLEMLDLKPGERVLELAAGSGGLTLHLARAVGGKGDVLATDLGPKMLQLAAHNARVAGLSNVSTRVMDGENPDLPDNSVDAAACRQGLMLFPHPLAALEGLFRIVQPGGRVAVSVFTTPERNGFLMTPMGALARWSKPENDKAADGPGPFSLGAPGKLEGLFLRAGYRDVRSRIASSSFRAASTDDFVRFYREVLPGLAADVPEGEREEAWASVAAAVAKYAQAGGGGAPCELLIVSGHKPAMTR